LSKVYFTSDAAKAAELFDAAGFFKLIVPGEETALKIHFGEPGNTAYLKPHMVRGICEKIKALGGKPFYTDCNTLYKGPRDNTPDHLKVAADHGYTLESAGAEVFIPEEDDKIEVSADLRHFKKLFLTGLLGRVKTIIALTHFKGHDVTGFGGALKNLGMGFGTRQGKLKMHSDCEHCPEVKTCKKNLTIESCWFGSSAIVQEKIAEYAYGAVKDKKAGYFNFLTDVSPNCDCYDHNDPPIVPDIGVLASLDAVAIDQASVDLVNQTEGRIKSRNKFRALYSNVDWSIQLKHAEKIGLGSRKYELVEI
jgi:hypothetical protein